MDKKTFQQYGYKFIDWLADYFETVEQLPVRAQVKPGEIRDKIPLSPPVQGETVEQLFDDFQRIIVPGMTHWQHPGWFAYFPATNSPVSVLAELLTAGMGAQCMVWQTSPAATELEEVVLNWLAQMLDLPDGMQGVIQDTASTATLCALLTARERATQFRSNEVGVDRRLIVYTSEESHSSVEKGAKIAGLGRQNVRSIATDDDFGMAPAALKRAIEADLRQGYTPMCVSATVGTTASTGVDPLRAIGEICRSHNLWFHVDAAYAGTAAILPEKRWIFDGIEMADSLVINPHKWMLTNFDCSTYFVKDAALLRRTFEIHPEYLKTGVDELVNNYRDWGVQLGRRFRALKLWFVIRFYGVAGLQQVVRRHIELAEAFRIAVERDSRFEVTAPSHFGLVCFRLNDGRDASELNRLNRRLHDLLLEQKEIMLTHAVLKEKYVLRMAIGSRTTQLNHVLGAWEIIQKTATQLIN